MEGKIQVVRTNGACENMSKRLRQTDTITFHQSYLCVYMY